MVYHLIIIEKKLIYRVLHGYNYSNIIIFFIVFVIYNLHNGYFWSNYVSYLSRCIPM